MPHKINWVRCLQHEGNPSQEIDRGRGSWGLFFQPNTVACPSNRKIELQITWFVRQYALMLTDNASESCLYHQPQYRKVRWDAPKYFLNSGESRTNQPDTRIDQNAVFRGFNFGLIQDVIMNNGRRKFGINDNTSKISTMLDSPIPAAWDIKVKVNSVHQYRYTVHLLL